MCVLPTGALGNHRSALGTVNMMKDFVSVVKCFLGGFIKRVDILQHWLTVIVQVCHFLIRMIFPGETFLFSSRNVQLSENDQKQTAGKLRGNMFNLDFQSGQ